MAHDMQGEPGKFTLAVYKTDSVGELKEDRTMAIKDIYEGVLAFQVDKVKELTQSELDAGTDIQTLLDDGLIGAMDEVGQKFSEGILFVPEMLMAAQAMKGGFSNPGLP